MGCKIAFSIIVSILGIYVLGNIRGINNLVMERLYSEKKTLTRLQKGNAYLSAFQTKIVTHVKASPTDFCRILTNPIYYKNFKFDLPTPPQASVDPSKDEKHKAAQEATDKEFKDLAKDNFDELN